MTQIRIFISHSSRDDVLAHALVDLLRSAINLPANQIRCTSVDGHRLEGGAQTDPQLREEIAAADVFLGLVSPISIESAYVLFEMGARWGSNRRLIPLLAPGADVSHLRGPLAGVNALRCNAESDLHQLLAQVAAALELTLEPTAAYLDKLRAVQQSAPRPEPVPAPVSHTTPVPLDLTAEHEALIKIFAQADWEFAPADPLAKMAGFSRNRTQHLLDQLLDAHLVLLSATKTGSAIYSLSKAGRAHAVKQGYC